MARLGSDDMLAALIYQRATSDTDRLAGMLLEPWLTAPNGTLMARRARCGEPTTRIAFH
ncbi:hypothetical protein [Amycolatopsis alkalitolerans]|nr:hypothetical protein [Amycolatopsis alkalitolerans]